MANKDIKSDIIVIARYPSGREQEDGMFQRILAIDKLFQNKKRIYLESANRPLYLMIYRTAKDLLYRRHAEDLSDKNIKTTQKYTD